MAASTPGPKSYPRLLEVHALYLCVLMGQQLTSQSGVERWLGAAGQERGNEEDLAGGGQSSLRSGLNPRRGAGIPS